MPKRKRRYDPAGPLDSAEKVLALLAAVDAHIDALLEPVREDVQTIAARLGGKALDSLESNIELATSLQRLLNRLDLRVRCPRAGCGEPAYLRCHASPGVQNGIFQLQHSGWGRRPTNHLGGTRLPELVLVRTPPERRPAPGRGKKR